MYTKFRNTMLVTSILFASSAHADQKPLSDDQLNALYFYNVATLAADKCGYKINADLFAFIFAEYELTEEHIDHNGEHSDTTESINQQADQFMTNTSCEKLSELFGVNGKALPGMLIAQ